VAVLAPTLGADARFRIERALLVSTRSPEARSALEQSRTTEFAALEAFDQAALDMLAEQERVVR
jgi:hypothetical protein